MQKRKSFREIARECNVSPATVSRIANGIGSFKEETKNRVMSCLVREGYIEEKKEEAPAFRKIALIATDLNNEIFCRITSHMRDYLRERNYLLSIYIESQNQNDLVNEILKSPIEGLAILSSSYQPLQLDSPVPAVTILASQSQVTYQGKEYKVNSDDYVGGQLAAAELIRSGCRRPLILNSRYMHSSVSPRVHGFTDEFLKIGVARDDILIYEAEPSKSSFNSARDAVSYLRTKGELFDCIFACSDWRAYGALVALANMDIEVPDQVKLIGYDGILISHYSEHPLTTIQQNSDMLAESAAGTLLSLIEGEPAQTDIYIPVQIQRGSTV